MKGEVGGLKLEVASYKSKVGVGVVFITNLMT